MRKVPLGGGWGWKGKGSTVLYLLQGEHSTSDAWDKGTESSILWGGGGGG